jgi:outer membrane receptor protein involved in Fe transport
MLSNPKLASAVRLALVSSAATAALYAPATFAAEEQTMEVTVTGSRIAKPDLESNSPITTVTAEAIEQLNTVNLEGQLRQLPQFLPGSTEYINNGNPGAATINLRGLGSNRTLVLMDGKRLPPFGTSGAVDINLIPAALIERVDIVTGGASAVYGSDAVSGVVNFITKKNFEGLQVDANTSQYGKGDGKTTSGAITAGGKFADDRGSAVISFGYTKRDAVLQGARAYSNYFLNPVDGYRYNGNWYQYSSDIFDAGRRGGSSNAGASRASLQTSPTARGTRYFTPDGQLLSGGGLSGTPYSPNRSYNYNPYNYFQVPQTRWSAMGSLNFQLTDSAEIYSRVFAVNGSVPTQLAPSAYFGGSTLDFQLNLDNPFLSAAQRTALISVYNNEASRGLHGGTPYDAAAAAGSQTVTVSGLRRRLPELGNRLGISESKTFQISGGVRGDLGDSGWNYDVSAQWGRVSRLDGLENDVSIVRAQQALLAIQTPTGIQCIDTSKGCAPVNLFTGNGFIDASSGQPMTGAISQAGLEFIRASYYSSQTTEAHNASASISGEVDALKSPMADAPVSLAFGLDWNEYTASFRPDDLTRFGGAMGQGGTSPPLSGSVDSKEFFGEAYVPLVTGKPGIENLALEVGYRYAETNLAGSFGTWKAGLEWTPVQSLRVRAMAQRAVRAPNIGEQFAPASFGLTEVRSDPCAGTAPVGNATLTAKCIAQGAPLAAIGLIASPAAQQAASIGGGAVALGVTLVPEEADTYTFGLQYTPEALPGFVASVDYYDIKINGGIGSYGAQEIVDNCFVNNISSFCSLVKRNPLGELEGDGYGIVLDTRNLTSLKASGIDYSVGYSFDWSEFKFNANLSGSHTLENSFVSSPGAPAIKCEGVYGDVCGNPTHKDRINLSLGVDWRSWSANVFVRHLSSVAVQTRADDPDQVGNSIYLIESIPAFNYVDLSVQWKWNDKLKVTLAAQNLLDKDPTVVGNIPGANTSMNAYADSYDPLGTRYSVGVSYKF